MATKSLNPSQGLQEQIDDLDALLDRLLKLPLGPTSSPGAPAPLKAATGPDSLDDILDESIDFDESILQFEKQETSAAPILEQRSLKLATLASDDEHSSASSSLDALEDDPSTLPIRVALKTSPTIDPEAIPWIDDEPTGQPRLEPPESTASQPASAGRAPVGARVEVIIGPTSTMVNRASLEPVPVAEPPVRLPSQAKRLCWWCNRCFDFTIGALFPILRKAWVKQLLGIAGIALLAASGYLLYCAWSQ